MPREKEGYHEQYAILKQLFPDREAISLDEACRVLGISRYVARKSKDFPAKKVSSTYVIPLIALARWMC